MFFKRKKENNKAEKTDNKRVIIDYKVFKLDYENFYSFSNLINEVDTISRSYIYNIESKKIVLGAVYDKELINIDSLTN